MARNNTHGKTIAQRNKEIRQEEHRTKIAESGQVGKVIDLANKIHDLAHLTVDVTQPDTNGDAEGNEKPISVAQQIRNLDVAFQARMKLVNKILPDMKAIEVDVNASLDVLEIDRRGIYDDDEDQG